MGARLRQGYGGAGSSGEIVENGLIVAPRVIPDFRFQISDFNQYSSIPSFAMRQIKFFADVLICDATILFLSVYEEHFV